MIFQIENIDMSKNSNVITPIEVSKFDRVKKEVTTLNGDIKIDTPAHPKHRITFTVEIITDTELQKLLDIFKNTFFNVIFQNANYNINADFKAQDYTTAIANLTNGIVYYNSVTFVLEQR